MERRIDTSKMDKVIGKDGREYAFAKIRKDEVGDYVCKVYVDGVYSEAKTYYTDDKEDAIETRTAMMNSVRA